MSVCVREKVCVWEGGGGEGRGGGAGRGDPCYLLEFLWIVL